MIKEPFQFLLIALLALLYPLPENQQWLLLVQFSAFLV